MYSKTLSRWLKLVFATLGLSALLGAGISLPSQAVSTTPTPYCSEGTCWVTFDYSGDYYTWVPPQGINSLSFEVFGAQGGRSGGKGGVVSGEFRVIPIALQVYVGGAGGLGNTVAGGFNGGGNSGSGHADAGSGGGASDLRTSTSLADRVVVAGGGGGTGGWIGGAGGAGGGLIATAGSKGSSAGTAGGGGTQLAGGSIGLGVSGGNGSLGAFGLGGNGGTGSIAGGGGGGGGFFGGGGGGSDSVSGGNDGAGGGGGSSYTSMALTSNVTHQSGARTGNGQIVLSYTFPPKATSFTLNSAPTVSNRATYSITFDQYVFDLDPTDFVFGGSVFGCAIPAVYGNGYSFNFEVANCSPGTLELSLRPNSVVGSSFGPTSSVAANAVKFDPVAPGFRFTTPLSPTNTASQTFYLIGDEAFQEPTSSAFTLSGQNCRITNITMNNPTTAVITVGDCAPETQVSISLRARALRDLIGNQGPQFEVGSNAVKLDRVIPAVTSIVVGETVPENLQYLVAFSEPVTGINMSSFEVSGEGCSLSKVEGLAASYQVWVSGCLGNSGMKVLPQVGRDSAGNLGPVEAFSFGDRPVDNTSPSAQIVEQGRANSSSMPSFSIEFNEPISGLTLDVFASRGSAKNCTFQLREVTAQVNYVLDAADCTPGTLQVTLLANSITDLAGNAGPEAAVNSPLVRLERVSENEEPSSPASTSSLEIPEGTPLVPTQNQPEAGVPKEPSRESQSWTQQLAIPAISSESWVAIAIAVLAVVLARRSSGRRAIRR